MYVCMYVCMYASIYLSIYLSIFLSVYLSVFLSFYPSILLSCCLSIHQSIYLPTIYASMYPSIHVSMHPCLYVSMSLCIYVSMPCCMHACIYASSLNLSTYHLSTFLPVVSTFHVRTACRYILSGMIAPRLPGHTPAPWGDWRVPNTAILGKTKQNPPSIQFLWCMCVCVRGRRLNYPQS